MFLRFRLAFLEADYVMLIMNGQRPAKKNDFTGVRKTVYDSLRSIFITQKNSGGK
jgi:hypothetical protein